jgi:glycosyltransferase involved in cell wall biosynthesis
LIAKNEEKVLRGCLESLKAQRIGVFLVVVNDGSTDNTSVVAAEYADLVIDLPAHVDNWTGKPELARIFNAGFTALEERNLDYLLISGADDVYPPEYLDRIIERMKKESIVLASGTVKSESSHSLSPRGGGRVLDTKWFKTVGFRYPENYGFEVYLVYKALSQGRKVSIFTDVTFSINRATKLSKKKLYLWGKGMKALHYWWLYAVGRCVLAGIRHPANGLAMLQGYLSDVPKRYDDIKNFVNHFQKRMLIRRLGEIL